MATYDSIRYQPGTVRVYANLAAFPSSGNAVGDHAFATNTKALYVWDGSEWDRVNADGDEAPRLTTTPATSVDLNSDGSNTTLTIAATDPEGFPITYSHDTNPASPDQVTAITNTGGTFTLVPSTNTSHAGNFTLRLKADDGVHISSAPATTVNLAFGHALWRIFVQSGSNWGGGSYWDVENEDDGNMGWITDSTTSANNNKNIIAGTVSGYGNELNPIGNGASSAVSKYGFWRGTDDFFSGTKHVFTDESVSADWFKTVGTSNARQYIATAASNTTDANKLSGNRDYLFWWFSENLTDAQIAGTYMRFDTFSNGRPERRPGGNILLQYYQGTLGSSYSSSNWTTWCTLAANIAGNGGDGGAYSRYVWGPLAKGQTITAASF